MEDLFDLCTRFIDANAAAVIIFSGILAVTLLYVEVKRNYLKKQS